MASTLVSVDSIQPLAEIRDALSYRQSGTVDVIVSGTITVATSATSVTLYTVPQGKTFILQDFNMTWAAATDGSKVVSLADSTSADTPVVVAFAITSDNTTSFSYKNIDRIFHKGVRLPAASQSVETYVYTLTGSLV